MVSFSPEFRWMRAATACVLGSLLLAAAIGKFISADAIRDALVYLAPAGVVTRDASRFMAAALTGYEAALGLALFLRPRSRVVLRATLITFVLYAIAVAWLVADERAPGCGCLGGWRRGGASSETWASVVRNVGLVGCAAVLLAGSVPVRGGPESPGPRERRVSRRGFTLPEVLVCILVTALVLALTLPSLNQVRKQSNVVKAVSTIRQIGVALTGYAQDNTEFLPFLGTPGAPEAPLIVSGHTLHPSLYFQQSRYYVNLLYPVYYADRRSLDRPFNHGVPALSDVIVARYDLTNCAFAAPGYWMGEDPPDDSSLFRGQRLADVAFPSRKGLLLDLATGVIAPHSREKFPGRITVGLADGSAGQRPYDESSEARIVTRPWGSTPWPVLATRGGFQGWDFEK